jgi:hypothetical protein
MPTWQRNPYPFHGENANNPFKDVGSFQDYPTLTYIGLHVISISQTGNNEPIGIPLPTPAGVEYDVRVDNKRSEKWFRILKFNGYVVPPPSGKHGPIGLHIMGVTIIPQMRSKSPDCV